MPKVFRAHSFVKLLHAFYLFIFICCIVIFSTMSFDNDRILKLNFTKRSNCWVKSLHNFNSDNVHIHSLEQWPNAYQAIPIALGDASYDIVQCIPHLHLFSNDDAICNTVQPLNFRFQREEPVKASYCFCWKIQPSILGGGTISSFRWGTAVPLRITDESLPT